MNDMLLWGAGGVSGFVSGEGGGCGFDIRR